MIIVAGRDGGYWGDVSLKSGADERERIGHSEVEELRVDYGKLKALTGWQPQYDWTTGLTETIKWYSENRTLWEGREDWS
jgi:dTDP-D-glucose 4,6-dehydratase